MSSKRVFMASLRILVALASLLSGILLLFQGASLLVSFILLRSDHGVGALLIGITTDNIFSHSDSPKSFALNVPFGSFEFFALVATYMVVGLLLVLLGGVALRSLKAHRRRNNGAY